MGWLRLVGSPNTLVIFAKAPYKRDSLLQKRPIFLRSLLIVATPYHQTYSFWSQVTVLDDIGLHILSKTKKQNQKKLLLSPCRYMALEFTFCLMPMSNEQFLLISTAVATDSFSRRGTQWTKFCHSSWVSPKVKLPQLNWWSDWQLPELHRFNFGSRQ